MKIIKLPIPYSADRERLISALANSGYKVWVEEEDDDSYATALFTVCFELKNIKD